MGVFQLLDWLAACSSTRPWQTDFSVAQSSDGCRLWLYNDNPLSASSAVYNDSCAQSVADCSGITHARAAPVDPVGPQRFRSKCFRSQYLLVTLYSSYGLVSRLAVRWPTFMVGQFYDGV